MGYENSLFASHLLPELPVDPIWIPAGEEGEPLDCEAEDFIDGEWIKPVAVRFEDD